MTQASDWQKRIDGDWHGVPGVFDAQGNHVGHVKVTRASVLENGRTTYTMDTDLDVKGPLRARFEAGGFAFGVLDEGADRVYLGPDFVGAGHPCGALVDAHYYGPGWTSDLRTMVHVLPDGATQAYSSLLYDGPTVVAVFNGLYTRGDAGAPAVDAFLARERVQSARTHVLPYKEAGAWRGELSVHGKDRELLGVAMARVAYRPTSLLRADVRVSVEGPWSTSFAFTRARTGNRHTFEGPDMFGNAMAYGRALYTTQHLFGRAVKLRGREFLLDDAYTMSVVWQVLESDRVTYTLYGRLAWEPGEAVLGARYTGS